jgi:hypothetical protein
MGVASVFRGASVCISFSVRGWRPSDYRAEFIREFYPEDACGDEYRDYVAATGAGMHPFIASFGFEDHTRLRDDFGVPEDVMARTPLELASRLCHAIDLDYPVDMPAVPVVG